MDKDFDEALIWNLGLLKLFRHSPDPSISDKQQRERPAKYPLL